MSSRDDEAPADNENENENEPWQRQLTALGGFIRVRRRLANMSLREMASLTSVSNAYLSQIERGLHQPSLRVLRSIAQALSIAPEELLRRANFLPSRGGGDAASGAGGLSEAGGAAGGGGANAAGGSSNGDGAAGQDPGLPDTEAAIAADPRLTTGQREALLNVYRSFRDSASAPRTDSGEPARPRTRRGRAGQRQP